MVTIEPIKWKIAGPTRDVLLTSQEASMLRALMAVPGIYVKTDDLCSEIWPDPDKEPDDAYGVIRQVALRLRRKIARGGSTDTFVVGKSRLGYQLRG
jgi:DNA-binding response OmpR family regulator